MADVLLKKPIAYRKPIKGSGGGGGKSGGGGTTHVASEDPNTLRSAATARIVDFISAGEIVGLVDGAKSIFFDNTPLQDVNGNYNFAGVTYEQRTGLPDQSYISGFPDAENTVSVGAEVTAATPVIRTLAGPIDAAKVTIRIPQLTSQDTSNGDLHGSTVTFAIYKRINGSSTWTLVHNPTITGKTVSPYEVPYRIELGGATDWDIKVERQTPDSTAVTLVNKTFWSTTTIITDGKFKYPNAGLVSTAADAQQFGSNIPARSFQVKGIKLQIPSNYNPTTRVYTGIWDGTFQTAWSNNPAWVLYYLLTNKLNGLGRSIKAAQVDKWSLYSIAQYCDELVDNGRGGTEPRFTFNYEISQRDEAYKVIQAVASCFQGRVFWSSGLIMAFADMPRDPVKLVTPANIKDGLFTYEGTALKARHSVAMVTWFDPDDACRPAIEMVSDADQIAALGWSTIEISAYGCTSRSQANRLGKWLLDTERYATETVSYQAAWDHADVMPGDIIEVYDPNKAGLRMGGRVAAATTSSVTIDASIVIESGKTYTLKVVMPDGSLVSRPLNNSAGSTTVLTVASPFGTVPAVNALWGITVSDLAPRQFRVMRVTEEADGYFTVSAIVHDPSKYARIEQGIKLDPVNYTLYTRAKPTAPANLEVSEYLYKNNGVLYSAATISWSPPSDQNNIVTYEVQQQRNDGNWETISKTHATSVDLRPAEIGALTIRVRANGFAGLNSDWQSKDFTLFGLRAPPADVQNFAMSVLGQIATLRWDANTDLDIAYYRIKFAPVLTGATWSTAVDLLPKITGNSVQVPAQVGTYLIKAVDQTEIESLNATAIVTSVSAVLGFNAIATISDAPSWAGTHDGTAAISGVLQLTSIDTIGDWGSLGEVWSLAYGHGVRSEGTYIFQNVFDLGSVFTSRVGAAISASGNNILNTIGSWLTLDNVETLGGADPTLWDVQVMLRTTNDDPGGTPVWSEWKNLVIGDYTARAFQFAVKLISKAINITPVVSDVSITIDMPDRTDAANGVLVSTSGITVTYNPPFRATPAVGITGQNLQTGDFWEYTSLPSATGFAGRWKNSAGTIVARYMDHISVGYGFGS